MNALEVFVAYVIGVALIAASIVIAGLAAHAVWKGFMVGWGWA